MDDKEALVLLLGNELINSIRRTRNSKLIFLLYIRRRQRILPAYSRLLYPTYMMILDRLSSREVTTRQFWTLPRRQNWFSILMERRDLDF